jgi:hypothetical protein
MQILPLFDASRRNLPFFLFIKAKKRLLLGCVLLSHKEFDEQKGAQKVLLNLF